MASGAPFLLFTDSPPLREGGHGCNILSRNLLENLGPLFGLVITRRMSRHTRRTDIWQTSDTPALIFPDATWFRPRWLQPWIDLFLFIASLPWLAMGVRRSGCQRIFALFGAGSWFLPKVDLLRRVTGLPLDIYLVDDLEATCRLNGRNWQAWFVRRIEPWVLRRAARVFVISPGYKELLAAKYGQSAQWLPVAVEADNIQHSPYHPAIPDRREIVFVGSTNFLYIDGLYRLYEEISRWNRSPNLPYELRLRMFSRREPATLLDLLPDRDFLDLTLDLDDGSLHEALRAAWAVFLPYSFDEGSRVMVSTSFSHKFTESITSGRPVIVFGPPQASLSRYFREEGLPLSAESPGELASVLTEIPTHDNPALTERYRALVQRYHSAPALRRVLDLKPPDKPISSSRQIA